ncbi:hypothetical protein D3C72_59810 [compost metagenome]
MPHDCSSGTAPLRHRLGGLIAVGTLLMATGCVWVDHTPFGGRPGELKTAFGHEDPLEITSSVHEVEPRLDGNLRVPRFSERSRVFVWEDPVRNTIMGAEIGGSAKEFAPSRGSWQIDWTADGRKFLLTDLISAPQQGPTTTPYRATLYSLNGDAPVVIGEMSDSRGAIMPDGSGLTYTRLVNEPKSGSMMPAPDVHNRDPKRLMIRLPSQAETEEAVLNGPGLGFWSHDAQHYAYLEHRDGNPINGLDLRVYDRQTKTSALRYHIESDDLQKVMNGLSWSADNTLWFAQACQVQASASIAVSSIPVDGKAVTLSVVPISLEEGETISSLRLSPDQTRVSFETQKVVTLTDGTGKVTGPRSSGLVVASLKTGKTRRLTPRGQFLSWLPGGDELIAKTGYGPDPRYYRIAVPRAEEI